MAIPNRVMKFKSVGNFWIFFEILFDLSSVLACRVESIKAQPSILRPWHRRIEEWKFILCWWQHDENSNFLTKHHYNYLPGNFSTWDCCFRQQIHVHLIWRMRPFWRHYKKVTKVTKVRLSQHKSADEREHTTITTAMIASGQSWVR